MKQISQILMVMRWLILLIFAVYLLAMTTGFLVDVLVEPTTSAIELVKSVFELGLWLAVPVLLILLLLRAWRLSLFAVFIVILFAIIYVPQIMPRSPDFASDTPRLTIMTFNLKATSEGIAEAIRSADADVVALQELSQTGAEAIQTLEAIYPYQALHPQQEPTKGQGILSRYPIETDEYWEYPELPHTLGHQRVEVDFDGTLIVIYNTHPWPPLAWESGYNDESHRVVVQDIAERTLAEELPLILVGDFNMTDRFEEYALLANHFTDSYRAAGDGIGYTFPDKKYRPVPSILRLDYVWHTDHFQSIAAVVWGDPAQSDHSPVVATLAFLQP